MRAQETISQRTRPNLAALSREELARFLASMGEPAYRADQILDWIYRKGVTDTAAMTNLPLALRERLAAEAYVGSLSVLRRQVAADGTRKLLLAAAGGDAVEAVLIPEGDRRTACISSQVGCALGCKFCATALQGLTRNLAAWEMAAQILALQRETGERVTNVVFMGMGEPLANYPQVLAAVGTITDPEGLGIGARRITVSTVGIAPRIRQLAREAPQVVLAVSLHAPDDATRDRIIPLNRTYPVAELLDACREHVALTGRRLTFEYILIRDVNDSPGHARRLARLLSSVLCHVNLIPMNPVPESGFQRPDETRAARFLEIVTAAGIPATMRKEKGTDIQAACGQLRNTASP